MPAPRAASARGAMRPGRGGARPGSGRRAPAARAPGAACVAGRLLALLAVAAATDATVFLAFIEGVLAPALKRRPEAVPVLDNLAVHKTPAARAALDRADRK